MSERSLFLDRGIGETRGVVLLDGRPERLLIERDGDDQATRLGARHIARVRKVEPAFASAFVDLGGVEALFSFKPDARPVEGQSLEVEIRTEPRLGKLATVRVIGPAQGAPRPLAAPPSMAEQLMNFARGVDIIEGREARQVADEAEAEALDIIHPLPGGGNIAIEPTRALVAIDVDIGERKGNDVKRVTRAANLAALAAAGRLLRLKSLGGIVVIDLVGRGHDGNALLTAARSAFSPDNPGVAIGPVGRFGTMEMTIPRRAPPVAETLCDATGALSNLTLALRLIRAIDNEGAAQPGARLTAVCAPAVAEAAKPLAMKLAARIGARFTIRPEPASARERFDVSAS
ncbi:MAG: ribonuclease E/G [Phenylobacterium sp.]|uniref:ribonuclease E/G n=1 Tax=Phenylobacterium sp. TaxID=1871053 RepID=UPI0027264B56|nr:ribonuclease E/G [Phenylobacterium sp.]MDO9432051.1 ribonuclease E/G [Phenylobacterium sp.]